MNIIFLDVDGVLNSVNNLIRIHKKTNKSYSCYSYPFDYECLENLKELVFRTKSNIVISSSWRKSKEGMQKLFEVLKMYELDELVIGATPFLGTNRGEEISKYLDSIKYIDIINFVILDDDNDMENLSDHLVLINNMTGLTHENVDEALKMFEEQKSKKLIYTIK